MICKNAPQPRIRPDGEGKRVSGKSPSVHAQPIQSKREREPSCNISRIRTQEKRTIDTKRRGGQRDRRDRDGEASNTPLRTHGHGPRKTTCEDRRRSCLRPGSSGRQILPSIDDSRLRPSNQDRESSFHVSLVGVVEEET